MLIGPTEQGTFTAGPLDVLCILHDVNTKRYHVAFFEEAPMPGPIPDVNDMKYVRLKSRMHHTIGSDSLEGASAHLKELEEKIHVLPENIWREPKDWDGQIGIVWVVNNWRRL